MAFAHLKDVHPYHGACITHEMRGLGCREHDHMRQRDDWRCRICGITGLYTLVTDHDHAVGSHAIRGTLCAGCNGNHMSRIDSGEYPIDPVTLKYIAEPWYLARRGLRLTHNPLVSIRLADLSAADRTELNRLHEPGTPVNRLAVRDRLPQLREPRIAQCISFGDLRPVLRLIRMAHEWNRPDLDIASLQTGQLGRRSQSRFVTGTSEERPQMTTPTDSKPRQRRVLDHHWGDPRRDAILAFIDTYCGQHGYGPSMREIAAGVGLSHAAAVSYHLGILLNAGCITRTPGIARSIRVVEA